MNARLLTVGCMGFLIQVSSHVSAGQLPIAPSTLPPACVWVPAIAYPFAAFAAPVLTYLPYSGVAAPPPPTAAPAQAVGSSPGMPNWFTPVPGWQTLAIPAHPSLPLCLPAPSHWSP
jgi:hypothetical protein